MRNRFIAALVILLMLARPAAASQNSLVIPNTGTLSGLTLVNDTNNAFNTLVTNNSGSSAPGTEYSYQFWADTTNNLLKFTPDGTNFYPMGAFSGSQWAAISNGVPLTIPSSTGSSNAYVVTYSPVPSAYVTGQHYPFIANFANTGSATENANSLGAKTIKKLGGTNLASGDIANGAVVDTVYDGTNMQMTSQISNGVTGTVTSIATNNGITGGTITTTGTIGLASIANNNILANTSGSSGPPTATALDGTLNINGSSNLACTTATTSQKGCVEPDGTTITVSSGVISASGGALTLLKTVNASASSSVSFSSTYITTTYNKYIIEFDGVYTSDGGSLYLTESTNNGTSYLNANYYCAGATLGSTSHGNLTSQSQIDLTVGQLSSNATSSTSTNVSAGTLTLSNLATAVVAEVSFDIAWSPVNALGPTTQAENRISGQAFNTSTTAINNIKITDGSGGTITGNFHLYGVSGN